MESCRKKRRIPPLGQRIVRSAIAIALCLVVDVLRGHRGIPLYAALAALQCITPYTRSMKGVARNRILGTVIGAVWGILLLFIEGALSGGKGLSTGLHYALVPSMLILVLYSTVLMGVQEMAYLAGVVYLVITINHAEDATPYAFALNRLFDTTIGVLVASFVNRLHLPRRRDTDTLFVSALTDSLLGSDRSLSPYSLVELNRLLDDGMKYTISTMQTQAAVRELLPNVRLRYPIIAMDGAALYDMKELRYVHTLPMPEENAAWLTEWLRTRGVPHFTNSIEQDLLVIRYGEPVNDGMRAMIEKKRHSPYRNYVRGGSEPAHGVVYVLVMETPERAETIRTEFLREKNAGKFRVDFRPSEIDGWIAIKIYDAGCTREAMLLELEKRMGTRQTVTFGGVPGKYDVYIEDSDRDLLVKELKHRFEPVDFRMIARLIKRGAKGGRDE